MANDAYMVFTPYTGTFQYSESQADLSGSTGPLATGIADQATMKVANGKISSFGMVFEVEDYSFDIEQTINLGSQSGGGAAGRVTINPVSITRKIDNASAYFYQMCCQGVAFKFVALGLRKATGTIQQFFLRFDFKMVYVKTISWAHDEESPKETIAFSFGAMIVRYLPQQPDGTLYSTVAQGGWNQVKNVTDVSPTTAI